MYLNELASLYPGVQIHSRMATNQVVGFHLRSHLQSCGQRGYREEELWFHGCEREVSA